MSITPDLGYKWDMAHNAEKKTKQILINLAPSDYEAVLNVAYPDDLGYWNFCRDEVMEPIPAKDLEHAKEIAAKILEGEP